MRVFLSWSGEESHQVAAALKDWLPNVIQALDPWLSSSDIEKGEAWFSAISESLVKSDGIGVFCLTAANLTSPWLAYEAGAIGSVDKGRVATFLFRVDPSTVRPPLGLFQATSAESKTDVLKLLVGLNQRLSSPLKDSLLQKAFETNWPTLEAQLSQVKSVKVESKNAKEDSQTLLQEILGVVRRIEKDGLGRGGSDGLLGAIQSPRVGPGGSGAGLLSAIKANNTETAVDQLAAILRQNDSARTNFTEAMLSDSKSVKNFAAALEASNKPADLNVLMRLLEKRNGDPGKSGGGLLSPE